jgi:hypothetical protein
MDRVQPERHRSRRSWVAPLVGVGAVTAVVAATLVITNRPQADPGVAGTPTPLTSPEAKVGVDLGTVSKADVAKLMAACRLPGDARAAELVWSRRVRGITKGSTELVAALETKGATAKRPTTAPAGAELGGRVCTARLLPDGGHALAAGRVYDNTWRTRPTAKRPMVALEQSPGQFSNDLHTLQAWALFRALPDVATVEARYVLNGRPGPWTKGVVDGGFAYTQVQAYGKFTPGQGMQTEVRAFDAQGRLMGALDTQARLIPVR